jgi:flagella basal body P-ring formation protein FlgA
MFNKFMESIKRLTSGLALVGLLLGLNPAQAQVEAGRTELMGAAQHWLDQAVSGIHPSATSPLRMEVSVGELDSRLRLAPCARVEPYIPVGTSLWGKTRLGLRCLEGASKWNVFLPVTIKAIGLAWVVRGNIRAADVLGEADAMQAEVDWAAENSPIVANSAQWIGQVATRALSTGQALRQEMLKPAQVFQAGSQVRVIAQGAGFEVTSDGQALSAGVVGQPARVRMDSGRVMSGVVMDRRTVRLEI